MLDLHGHLFSSYTWKALIPLYANDTPFNFVEMGSDRPELGLRDEPDEKEVAAGKARILQAYDWLEGWLGSNTLPRHVSLVTCAAAPSLFYADWIEPITTGRTRLSALRAELLALPPVSRCVEDARPFRPYFPLGAPDRD